MTRTTAVLVGTVAILGLALVTTLGACSNKASQVYNDSPRTATQNSAPATVGNMPDGFSNWARKCDGDNMVYVLYHGDSAYGSISVVPDSRCMAPVK